MDENNKNNPKENNASRHTWIGDEEELRQQEAMAERKTYTLSPQATRIVERQRKKRTGFITDEELANSEIIRIEDRKTTLVNKDDISQTRIYDPFEKDGKTSGKAENEKPAKPAKPKNLIITIPDKRRARLLIAALAAVVLILVFEISFFAMRSSVAELPEKTKAVTTQTAEISEENEKLTEQVAAYGDEKEMKELKESWERQKEKLGASE